MTEYLNECMEFMKRVKEHKSSYIFLQRIEEIIDAIPSYLEIIKTPIDLNKIEDRLVSGKYSSLDELKEDFDLMFNNCKTFNQEKNQWVTKACTMLETFVKNNFVKLVQKVDKLKEKKAHAVSRQVHKDNYDSQSNIQIITNSEDTRLAKRIKTIFLKVEENLKMAPEDRDGLINIIVKNILKRLKTFEVIYDDTMKQVSKFIDNEQAKNNFSKKFRKLLRTIKQETVENSGAEKQSNIKINLNDTDEKREEKDKLDNIKKEIINFIDSQKIPEVYREITEYPIDPNLRKKITNYINEKRETYMRTYS
jgi:hypothetical protein